MKQADISRFRHCLLTWYDANHRKLPWRETGDPYHIWVSEIMLQQTRVVTVIDYFNRFIQKFPDIRSLAEADLQEVLKSWEGLGYYSRARNLHKAVNQLIDSGRERVPDTPESFIELSGIGDYTNAAVQSIAFNHPLPVVDGNVKRVLSRLFLMTIPVNDSCVHKDFNEKAGRLLDHTNPSHFNQAMMELGALVCRPSSPLCSGCPVQCVCMAHASGTTADYPKRKKKKAVPTRHYTAGVVRVNGNVLVVKRKSNGFLGGMWEFPGGPVRKNGNPETTCVREIAKTTGVSIKKPNHLGRVNHTYSHFKLKLDLFECDADESDVILNGPEDYRWIPLSDTDKFPFHKAIHKCFSLI